MTRGAASKLKRFEIHGAIFLPEPTTGDKPQWIGDCPFCGRKGKFFVGCDTLYWDCKVCNRKGEFRDYLKEVAIRNHERFLLDYTAQQKLADDRGIKPDILRKYGVGFFAGIYTIPVYHGDSNTLINLKSYRPGTKLRNVIGGTNGLFGSHSIRKGTELWLTEGEWDCMALKEMLDEADIINTDVIAVPGADTFFPKWTGFFNNRIVYVAYDNDGEHEEYAAQHGMSKVQTMLSGVAKRLYFIHWPTGAPDGYDIRDFCIANGSYPPAAIKTLRGYFHKQPPSIPVERRPAGEAIKRAPVLEGISRQEVITEFQKVLHLPETDVIDVMFGTMYANKLDGDPLWMFLVGPPGCGKTELLLTLSESMYVYPITTMTSAALVSGAQMKDGADPSLIPQLDGLVLVVKDFTTILSKNKNELDEVFGILRDAFDGRFKKVFGTGVVRDYQSKFGILAGVTHHINAFHANTTVGERFLRYNVHQAQPPGGSEELIAKAMLNVQYQSNIRELLQRVGQRAADRAVTWQPERTKLWDEKIIPLAQVIAHMRGAVIRDRYSDEVIYLPTAEIGTRVASQLTKLAMGIALFREEKIITEDVYEIIARVARDTAPDRVQSLVRALYHSAAPVQDVKLGKITRLGTATSKKVLYDLRMLFVTEQSGSYGSYWKLTEDMRDMIKRAGIYQEIDKWRRTKVQRSPV